MRIDRNSRDYLSIWLFVSSTPLFDHCVPMVTTWYEFKLVFVIWARFDDKYILTNNNQLPKIATKLSQLVIVLTLHVSTVSGGRRFQQEEGPQI